MTAATMTTTAVLGGAALPGAGPLGNSPDPGSTNRGLCSLSFQGRTFPFRTNPNEIWWSYELITKVEQTYGGRVIQLLGTRLGDLAVKVECGKGGWPYLQQMVNWLRDLMSDQRGVTEPATFEYTARNWKLHVYALTIPFEDQMEATTREVVLNFKIQDDLTGLISQVTLDATLSQLKDGVIGPGQSPHNQYNDIKGAPNNLTEIDALGPGGPSYSPSGITNLVDVNPLGNNPGGVLGLLPSIPGVSSIPILGGLLG